MNSDLGFLLIFIILPTILIVSGFWLILLFRKESRIRELAQANMPPGLDAHESDAEVLDEPSSVAVDDGELAPDDVEIERELPLVVPDLEEATEQPVDQPDEEFWTEPLPNEPGPAVETQVPESPARFEPEPITGPGSLSGFTEQIPVVDETPHEDEEAAPPPSTGTVEQTAGDPGAENEPGLDDTAALPDDCEGDLDRADEGEVDDRDEQDPDQRRRQPGALLVPSTENVRRRTGTASRKRATPIPRSVPRDEDTVEGTDRS